MDKLHIRDCYAQLRSIRRLILQVTDDIGDLTVDRSASEDVRREMSDIQDAITDMEHKLHGFQEKFQKLSG